MRPEFRWDRPPAWQFALKPFAIDAITPTASSILLDNAWGRIELLTSAGATGNSNFFVLTFEVVLRLATRVTLIARLIRK